jgi:hypothetical protein
MNVCLSHWQPVGVGKTRPRSFGVRAKSSLAQELRLYFPSGSGCFHRPHVAALEDVGLRPHDSSVVSLSAARSSRFKARVTCPLAAWMVRLVASSGSTALTRSSRSWVSDWPHRRSAHGVPKRA